MTNEELLKEYPFLSILNSIYPEYYYNSDYTLLDDMPSGWRKRFGLQMCADIKQALEKNNIEVESYQVFQVKEKFGELRWYDNDICEDVRDIIDIYCFISKYISYDCGDIRASIKRIPNKYSYSTFIDNTLTLITIDITETLYKIGFSKEDILWLK